MLLFGTDTSFILALPKIVGNLQNPLFRPVVFGCSIQSGTFLLLFFPTLILFGESLFRPSLPVLLGLGLGRQFCMRMNI